MGPVHPEETVSEVLRRRPQAARAFFRRRMACPGCAMASFETVEEVARVYRVPLEPFLRELAACPENPPPTQGRGPTSRPAQGGSSADEEDESCPS